MNIIDLATKTMQTAIKGVVDMIKVNVDSTKTKVDTIANKVDDMNVKVGSILDGRVVKSVQRGIFNIIDTDGGRKTITISAVNINKCFVQIQGTGSSFNLDQNGGIFVNSITSTSFSVLSSASVSYGSFSWQVIEFY